MVCILFNCRFNGYDQRLDRELEAVVMVMEAFEGFEKRVRYDIVGHSGESKCIPFVDVKNPPNDPKMRLNAIRVCGKLQLSAAKLILFFS